MIMYLGHTTRRKKHLWMYTAKLLLNPVISGSSSGINNHRNIGLFFFLSPGSSAKKGRSGPACDSAHIRSVPHVAPKLSQMSHTATPAHTALNPCWALITPTQERMEGRGPVGHRACPYTRLWGPPHRASTLTQRQDLVLNFQSSS